MEQINIKHAATGPAPARLGRTRRAAAGFTLVEILLVTVVMVLLMAFVVPAMNTMIEGNNITRSGKIVTDQIKLARQIASSSNRSVRVMFLELPPLSGGASGYNAIQLWWGNPPALSGLATYVPITKIVAFPTGIAISEQASLTGVSLSYILAATDFNTAGYDLVQTGSNQNQLAGGGINNVYYFAIEIKPSGLVIPVTHSTAKGFGAPAGYTNVMSGIYMTVLPARLAGKTLPTSYPNYATIQINPLTGSTILYRP